MKAQVCEWRYLASLRRALARAHVAARLQVRLG